MRKLLVLAIGLLLTSTSIFAVDCTVGEVKEADNQVTTTVTCNATLKARSTADLASLFSGEATKKAQEAVKAHCQSAGKSIAELSVDYSNDVSIVGEDYSDRSVFKSFPVIAECN